MRVWNRGGTIRWEKLLEWLRLVHEEYALPRLRFTTRERREEVVAAVRAFELVESLRDMPWDMVALMLEQHRETVVRLVPSVGW